MKEGTRAMMKKLNRARIVEGASCQREDGIYAVTSSAFDNIIGAADTEGIAWQRFFEHLDDLFDAYHEGVLSGFEDPAKALGRKGGQVKSTAKALAAAENGKKGGRPKRCPTCGEKMIRNQNIKSGQTWLCDHANKRLTS
jgi:hypothetical protein